MLTGEEALEQAGVRLIMDAPALVQQDKVDWYIVSTTKLAPDLYEVAVFREKLTKKETWQEPLDWRRFASEEEALRTHSKAIRKIRSLLKEDGIKVDPTVHIYP